MELLVNILGILNNISRYHWLVNSIFESPGAVLTLVEQLQTFRDKIGPYLLCINILHKIFADKRRCDQFYHKDEFKSRTTVIIEYHSRKAAMERKCIACAKSGSSVAFLVEAKRKLKDAILQGDALTSVVKLVEED